MRRIFTLMLLTLLFTQVRAQEKTISGRITDASGQPVESVSILVRGSSVGTSTDANGRFTLNLPQNARSISISAVGFKQIDVSVGTRSSFDFALENADAALEEVVVTGYQVVRKKDVAGAISKISSSEIDNVPIPNFAQAIQGRAAGVAVSAANGIPGGAINVLIRGVGSISAGSAPLYVVDGVQISTGTGSVNTQNNPLNFLNPDDIESIEILKDAGAASIYGARAGGGVIIVTTKKGKVGKPKFTFNTFYGQTKPLRMLNSLNTEEWYNARYEALLNANTNPTAATLASIRNTVLANMGLPSTVDVNKLDSVPSYDWQKETFGTGNISNIELAMQGGSQNINYYISASYSHQEAFIAPTDFKRAAILSKVSYKLSDKFTFDNSISLSSVTQNAPYSTGNTGFGNPAYSASMILPTNKFRNDDGTFFGLPGSGQNLAGTFNHNILAIGDFVKYYTKTNQMVGNAALTYNPTKNLTIRSLVGLDYRATLDDRYQDPRVNDGFAVQGRLTNQADYNTNFITTTTANWRKTIKEDHTVSALVGVEYRRDENSWFQADGQGFPSYQLRLLSSAATPTGVSGSWSANATWSQFMKLGYNYKSKYIANFILRRDASSRFGTNNQVGYFPAIQFAWNAKDENFLKDINAISDLKVRYSFGRSGNDQFGNFAFRQLYGASRIYGNVSAINPTQLGNPDLKWETREEHNIGVDVGFLNNRISLVFDAYKRRNFDLLLNRSLYQTTGFSSIAQNLGEVENMGLEFMLDVRPFVGKFKWTSSFNISFQKNQVTKLYDGITMLPGDNSIQVGAPLGSQFLAPWAGVNPATGRGMWYDINNNITYNPTAADRRIMGNIYPSKFGGWNNNLSYKGFSIEMFFQYEFGRERADVQLQQLMRMGGATVNTWKDGYDQRWQQPGDITWVPRPVNGMTDFNSVSWASGSRYIYRTDYIRLKQLTFAYDFNSGALRKFGMDNVRIYAQGLNLWTATKWNGYDPEFTGSNTGIIPQAKSYTFGVQVKF